MQAGEGEEDIYITFFKISLQGQSIIDMGGGFITSEAETEGLGNLLEGDLSGSFSNMSDSYDVFTRTLIANGDNANLNDYLNGVTEFKFTDLDGNALQKYDGELVADKDHLGYYRVYVDGNDLKVDYIAAKGIPEPSSATLGLLALSALFIRRKRA